MTSGANYLNDLIHHSKQGRQESLPGDSDLYWVTTRDGILIDTRESVWLVDGKRPLNVGCHAQDHRKRAAPGV
jgi:hypothetical protein